ncbi:hypothetical protein ACFL1E_04130 [Candidatus Omnitrophota bacterium]
MNKKSLTTTLIASCTVISLLLLCGCEVERPDYLQQQGIQRLKNICKFEFDINITTHLIGKTLWIYLPSKEPILKLKGCDECLAPFYIDSKPVFKDKILNIPYHVKPQCPDKHIRSTPTEVGSANFSHILEALNNTFGKPEGTIEFFIFVNADIVDGYEISYKIYKPDLIKMYTNAISFDEPAKRIITDTFGGSYIVNDRGGRHLNFYELDLRTFLAEQIKYRLGHIELNFEDDADERILEIVNHVLNSYEFEDCALVELENLDMDEKISISRQALSERFKE